MTAPVSADDSPLPMLRECPRCGGELIRIRRRLVDKALHLFNPVKRYRCDLCDHVLNLSAQAPQAQPVRTPGNRSPSTAG